MGKGLTAEDLYGSGVREPLCSFCGELATALSCMPGFVDDAQQLTAAVQALKVPECRHRGLMKQLTATAMPCAATNTVWVLQTCFPMYNQCTLILSYVTIYAHNRTCTASQPIVSSSLKHSQPRYVNKGHQHNIASDGLCTHMALHVGTQAASTSRRDAADGQLDSALTKLAIAIDPQAAASRSSSSRLERIELAVAHLQAAHILAHKQKQKAQQQTGNAVEQLAAAVGDLGIDADSAKSATAQVRLIAKLLGVDGSGRWVTNCNAVSWSFAQTLIGSRHMRGNLVHICSCYSYGPAAIEQNPAKLGG